MPKEIINIEKNGKKVTGFVQSINGKIKVEVD